MSANASPSAPWRATARRFFQRALSGLKVTWSRLSTDAVPIHLAVLEDLVRAAWHHVERQWRSRCLIVGQRLAGVILFQTSSKVDWGVRRQAGRRRRHRAFV
jgi:hypothetical protein